MSNDFPMFYVHYISLYMFQKILICSMNRYKSFLLFVANEVQLMKANVQSVVVSFVQNERNTFYQIGVIHLLICGKDRIFFFLGRSFSSKIFCLCLYSPLCQALVIKLEHTFSSFSTRVPPL